MAPDGGSGYFAMVVSEQWSLSGSHTHHLVRWRWGETLNTKFLVAINAPMSWWRMNSATGTIMLQANGNRPIINQKAQRNYKSFIWQREQIPLAFHDSNNTRPVILLESLLVHWLPNEFLLSSACMEWSLLFHCNWLSAFYGAFLQSPSIIEERQILILLLWHTLGKDLPLSQLPESCVLNVGQLFLCLPFCEPCSLPPYQWHCRIPWGSWFLLARILPCLVPEVFFPEEFCLSPAPPHRKVLKQLCKLLYATKRIEYHSKLFSRMNETSHSIFSHFLLQDIFIYTNLWDISNKPK